MADGVNAAQKTSGIVLSPGAMARSAMMLTAANLLLRTVSMGFGVYLSRKIGAAGMGLLQLTMSVSGLALTAGMAGIRTGTMYLTAEEIGAGRGQDIRGVLTHCFTYSLFWSCLAAAVLWLTAPVLGARWIGNPDTAKALRLVGAFLPVNCLIGVLTGYYTAQGRVGELAVIEIGEQLASITLTILILRIVQPEQPALACACVVGGSSCVSLLTLLALLWRCRGETCQKPVPQLRNRLLQICLPLALADDLRMGISAAENMLVPRRLNLYSRTEDALADYGRITGMVFPTLMFPAAILFSLSELLIPELSRCRAGGRWKRVRYLSRRSFRITLVYGLAMGSLLFITAKPLGALLYHSPEVGILLRRFSFVIPMLYLDAVTDSIIKGMGRQVITVRYNMITGILDVILKFFLLPRMGLDGYLLSFWISHGINFVLSFRLMESVTDYHPGFARHKFRPHRAPGQLISGG